MSTLEILAFLLLSFIIYANGLRCFSHDCPPDENDVCASAYCSVIPDPEGPFVEGTDLITECISGFDKASACKALDEKYCNTTDHYPWLMEGCKICSTDECNPEMQDEPDWRNTKPNHPDSTKITQNPTELSKSTTAGPDPMTTEPEIFLPVTAKNEPETATTIEDDESNNAIHHFTIRLCWMFILHCILVDIVGHVFVLII